MNGMGNIPLTTCYWGNKHILLGNHPPCMHQGWMIATTTRHMDGDLMGHLCLMAEANLLAPAPMQELDGVGKMAKKSRLLPGSPSNVRMARYLELSKGCFALVTFVDLRVVPELTLLWFK